jgi:hemolysin III
MSLHPYAEAVLDLGDRNPGVGVIAVDVCPGGVAEQIAEWEGEREQWSQRDSSEELANTVTHGLGAVLSVIGCCYLIGTAAAQGMTRQTIACSIFGATLVAMYAASTFYHAARDRELKRLARTIDCSCIYALIAGTYTPLCLVALDGFMGWSILAVVWSVALTGAYLQMTSSRLIESFPVSPYVALSWLVALSLYRLGDAIGAGGMAWFIGGGVFFMTGVLFFVRDDRRYFHTVWHFFTMAGNFCHYVVILQYVIR